MAASLFPLDAWNFAVDYVKFNDLFGNSHRHTSQSRLLSVTGCHNHFAPLVATQQRDKLHRPLTMGRRTKETILKFRHHFIWLLYSMSMRTNSFDFKTNRVIDYNPVLFFISIFSFATFSPPIHLIIMRRTSVYTVFISLDLWFYWRFIVAQIAKF